MPAKKPERIIPDSEIKSQAHLFVDEAPAPKPDLTTKVAWDTNVRIQRQRRILAKRIRIPPVVNHFNHTLDRGTAVQLFAFLERYKPETPAQRRERIEKKGEATAADLQATRALVYGIKDVTQAVEAKKARLVVIAHDVDPIELVVWLPSLCRKLEVPYVIVKGKSRLGTLVGMGTTTCVALKDVKQADRQKLSQILSAVQANFTLKYQEELHKWGGGELSDKTIAKLRAQGKHE